MATTAKANSYKVSPKGVINLAGSTVREIGLQRASGQHVRCGVEGNDVVITPSAKDDRDSVRVSPRGVLSLPENCRQALGSRYAVKQQGKGKLVLTRA